MNKLNKSAYMFLIWAAFLCCGCGGAQRTKMYLGASVQDERESGTGQDMSAFAGARRNAKLFCICLRRGKAPGRI